MIIVIIQFRIQAKTLYKIKIYEQKQVQLKLKNYLKNMKIKINKLQWIIFFNYEYYIIYI